VIPLFQSLVFMVLRSDFCVSFNCVLDESGICCIQAIVLYFIAGIILHFGTRNYPGNPYKRRNPNRFFCCRRCASDTETTDIIQSNGSPTTIEMANYNNGFADAIEIPVESNFIDRALIDSDAGVLPNPTSSDTSVESTIETVGTTPPINHALSHDEMTSKV
jgi:hypothetical protein